MCNIPERRENMADNGNVGIISLDLVIKQKIGEQLENIKRTVEAPAAKVGAAIENAISKPMEKAGKSIGKAVSNAVKSVDSAVSDDVSVSSIIHQYPLHPVFTYNRMDHQGIAMGVLDLWAKVVIRE